MCIRDRTKEEQRCAERSERPIFGGSSYPFPLLRNFQNRPDADQDAVQREKDQKDVYKRQVIKYAKRAGYTVCPYTDGILSCLLPSENTDIALRNYISSALDLSLIHISWVFSTGPGETKM